MILPLKKLADYTINRHYPEIINSKNKYRLLLEKTIDVQAKLVALWMNHGFIHGVMNTDNTTISGETIDYGPCAFMNNYDPLTVYSYIDINGRYSYGNQPKIMLWNLSIFAEAVWKLLHEEKKEAHQIILDCLKVYPILFEKYWIEGIKKKLGFTLSFSEEKI